MSWIKDVLVDLIVTVFILVAIFLETAWMWWMVIGYTILMVLAKSFVLAGDSALQLIRKSQTDAPDWFTHLLYAINTGALLLGGWWYTAGGWIIIWLLSYIAQRKLKASRGQA